MEPEDRLSERVGEPDAPAGPAGAGGVADGGAIAPEPEPGSVTVGQLVGYVVNKPLSAGEAPPILPAKVARVRDRASGQVDLKFVGPGGKVGETADWQFVSHSAAREPGTWHFNPEIAAGE